MALGKVSVNNLNLGQGAVTEIERYFLFIGPGAKSVGDAVNQTVVFAFMALFVVNVLITTIGIKLTAG